MIIKGVGVDIIEIERIRKTVNRRKNFVERFFNRGEISREVGNKAYYQEIASKFAAKEAVVKAMGTGFRGFSWKDINIINDYLGKPMVKLEGNAYKISANLGISGFMLSITHTKEYAAACVIAVSNINRRENF